MIKNTGLVGGYNFPARVVQIVWLDLLLRAVAHGKWNLKQYFAAHLELTSYHQINSDPTNILFDIASLEKESLPSWWLMITCTYFYCRRRRHRPLLISDDDAQINPIAHNLQRN